MAQRSWRYEDQSTRKIQVGFKSIQIFKDQNLGAGVYGSVCRAKCDDLLCAAKFLYPVLFDKERPHLVRKIEQVCEFISTLRHPNIIQYIGLHHDPDNGLPVLLMELMEENLTKYLKRCSQPVPYHLQVNICHSVASALSYLHANNIAHKELCSSNIRLIGNAQVTKISNVEVSFFSMSDYNDELVYPIHHEYASPQAISGDCFLFGIVMIQVLTRESDFFKPDDQKKYSSGKYSVTMKISEIEHLQTYLSKVDPAHSLLSIALDCLKDRETERPTAHQLCVTFEMLKESQRYRENKSNTSESAEADIQLQIEKQRQEQSQEEIYQQREVKQKEMLIEEVFKNARLAMERELQTERRRISELEQQLAQNQAETRRVEQQLHQEQMQSSQKERELFQARQQLSDIQQQVHAEQQRALQIQTELAQAMQQDSRERDQLHEHIRELEHRLEQSGPNALGLCVTGLQLLPQGDSWNIPRGEIQIIEQIGYGAAGLVSKGRYLDQEVAVKQIHQEILRERHIMDEFKREVGIMATIQHPNLVRFIAAVFDERVEQLRETPLLVLELLHTNLRDAYKDYNLGPSKSLPIFSDIAYGLHYLHEHSEPIIHRDVSAPNILLESLPGNMWRAKLSDFGSANFLKRAKTLGVGAIVYTAPEMFPREGPSAPMPCPTAKCDVFSYGIVIVEVITKTMPTIENRHQLFSEVERRWRLMYSLVSQCTEVSPHARPTMAEVLNTLNRIPIARPQ